MWRCYTKFLYFPDATDKGVRSTGTEDVAALFMAHQAAVDPTLAVLSQILRPDTAATELHVVREPIAGTDIQAGDVLALEPRTDDGTPPHFNGRARPVDRDGLEALRAALDASPTVILPTMTGGRRGTRWLDEQIGNRQKWGLRRKVWTPWLYVVRPFTVEGTFEVSAAGDSEAVDRLLSDLGRSEGADHA